MTEVLIIAYYFPPIAGAGVQRVLKFTKYLPEYGFKPVVLTVNPHLVRWQKDYTIMSDIPAEVKVYRTMTLDWQWIFKLLWGLKLNKVVDFLCREILIPDPEMSWLPFARRQIDTIIKAHNIKLAFITGSPFSSMLLGPYLKHTHGIDYILDFRDEWTNSPYRLDRKVSATTLKKELAMESLALRHCKAVTYINQSMGDSFIQNNEFLSKKPSTVIPNGFEEEEFEGISKNAGYNQSQLEIVYTGSFYGRRQPDLIWQALYELVKDRQLDVSKIRIRLIGRNTPSFVLGNYQENNTIKRIVSFEPYVNHRVMLQILVTAPILLLYIAPGKNAQAELTGKIYEYLRSYTPILAIVPPDGDAAAVISQCRAGWIYDSNDVSAIKAGLKMVYDKWLENKLVINPDISSIAKYERKYLTGDLAHLMRQLINLEQDTRPVQ